MTFMKLTPTSNYSGCKDSKISVNIEHISYINKHIDHTAILLCGETVITVKESFEEIIKRLKYANAVAYLDS